MVSTLKGFYDYTKDDLSTSIPAGTYQLRVRSGEVDHWDDGRPRLNISTTVVGGEHDGKFAPRLTYSVGASGGVTAAGVSFEISEEDAAKKLVRDIKAIRNGKPLALSNSSEYDEKMLQEIGRQLSGDEFIATVGIDKNGYAKTKRVYSLSEPPKSFKSGVAAFSLDSI